jgi:hypothetical protein
MPSNEQDISTIEIQIVRGTDPIQGSIRHQTGLRSTFTGWLELAGAIELAHCDIGDELATSEHSTTTPHHDTGSR